MPGFIDKINGEWRWRFTKPGTNPRNFNLNPNQVIFDSETVGNLNILDYGQNVSPAGATGNAIVRTQFRSWNLGYAPMVVAQIKLVDDPETEWSNIFSSSIRYCYLESTPNGLWFVTAGTNAIRTLAVRWTAFRFAI